jgi:hypothetical protein
MRRREFIAGLGSAAAWPVVARAQPARRASRIGFLGASTAAGYASRTEAFRQGLRDLGYVEGTNITIDHRWAEDKYERLPGLAAELVRSNVDLIVTSGTLRSPCCQAGNLNHPHCHSADRRSRCVRCRYQLRAARRKYHGTELFRSGIEGKKN